jgi:transcriptional regulator with XRE-family HTH domain
LFPFQVTDSPSKTTLFCEPGDLSSVFRHRSWFLGYFRPAHIGKVAAFAFFALPQKARYVSTSSAHFALPHSTLLPVVLYRLRAPNSSFRFGRRQMSNATQPTQIEAEEFVWPDFNPSIGHRSFIERLRLTRLERGLSIADMADEVELHHKLAYEFENALTPLPFDYLEVWCQAVRVPFEDFLAIYWADEEAYDAAKEAQSKTEQKTPGITNTSSGLTPEPALSHSSRAFGFLIRLRSEATRITKGFLSSFSTHH